MIASAGSVSLAEVNTYAPTLRDIVVVRDVMEIEILPGLFHSIMGEVFEMKLDDSCAEVRVQDKNVFCVSKERKATFVGLLDSSRGVNEGLESINVRWFDTIEIVESKNAQGRLNYSIRVK